MFLRFSGSRLLIGGTVNREGTQAQNQPPSEDYVCTETFSCRQKPVRQPISQIESELFAKHAAQFEYRFLSKDLNRFRQREQNAQETLFLHKFGIEFGCHDARPSQDVANRLLDLWN